MSAIWSDRPAPRRRALGASPAGAAWGLALALALLVLAGCAGAPRAVDPTAAGADGAAESVVPEAVRAAYARALESMAAQDFAGAAATLDPLCEAHPTLVGPRVNLAIALTNEGRYDEAEAALLAALDTRPRAVEAWNQLGVVYRHQGRFLSARDAYLEALTVDPDYALAHFNAAVLFDLYLHQYEEAMAHYERYRALAAAPDERVDGWLADLERRIEQEQRTAGLTDDEI